MRLPKINPYADAKLTWIANGATGTDYEGRTGLPMCDPWEWNMGYDANGNLSYDESHNITYISYNHLNQPTSICFADGSEIDNRYTSAGTKWESTYTLPDGTQSVTKYLGNAIVRDGQFDMLRTPWGYLDGNSMAHYYVTDYQGNVTHTVNDNAEIEQTVYYYPDGEPWVEPTGKNPFLFGGKERITFAGLRQYDFGARMLNASVGAWWQVDPMCEKYYPMSPYCSMGANPVMYTDPTGKDIFILLKSPNEFPSHMAMLIQEADEEREVKWKYYSINGDKMYNLTDGAVGRKHNDVGVGEWDNPQEFLDSDYNSRRDKESRDDFENYNGFAYEEGYQIETTPEQDEIMRNEFEKMAKTQYDLLDNNCATTVQHVMKAADLQIRYPVIQMPTSAGSIDLSPRKFLPRDAFQVIMDNYTGGKRYTKQSAR